MPADPHQVSLQNLYVSAQRFAKGSRDSNDLIDLSARLFPNSPEAAINAAGVALMGGNLELAGRYLAPYHTDSRAYCNLGVYYLLCGNRQRADVYLQMARAQGVAEAANALKSMQQ
jgi:Flp pilus assembly protein TadD